MWRSTRVSNMDRRSQALLAVGIALLATPVWAPALDVTGQDYVYRSVDLRVVDGELRVNDSDVAGRGPTPTDQFACMDPLAAIEDRGCLLEARLRNDTAAAVGGAPNLSFPKYAVFGAGGPVYRRTVDESAGRDAVGLERVDPATALADESHDPRRGPVRRALQNGRVRTADPVDLGSDDSTVYAHEGGYAVVYEASTPTGLSEQPGVERGFELLAVLLGAALVFRVGERNVRGGREDSP
jgi:hypothetical protein